MKFDKIIKILRVTLLLLFFSWGLILVSIQGYSKEVNQRNVIHKMVLGFYNTARIVNEWIQTELIREPQQYPMHEIEGLAKIGNMEDNPKLDKSLYLLHYVYLGDDLGEVLLQNIKNGDIAHKWTIPLSDILDDLSIIRDDLENNYVEGTVQHEMKVEVANSSPFVTIAAPIMLEDTSLIFHCRSYGFLYKLDKNSDLLWRTDRYTHHSIQIDEEGNIWSCSVSFDNEMANTHNFRDDAVVCFNPDGTEKYFFSLTELFLNNNIFKELIGSVPSKLQSYGLDPYHLNDVQPVNIDGLFWDKGDVLLSMRSQSLVALFRPSNDSVIWYQKGPWLSQHDVDVVNDSVISILNNNMLFANEETVFDGSSNITFYDFSNDQSRTFSDNIFASKIEGVQTITSTNEYIIEETHKARYYVVDSAENVICAFYVPYYYDEELPMKPNWARVYIKNDNNFVIQ